MNASSWISPKTTKGKISSIHGKGFFAVKDISKGEVVGVKGGHIIDRPTLDANRSVIRDSEMQITDDLFVAPLSDEEFEDSMIYINHSCDPNTGYGGNIVIVAMSDIKAGEELTIDYGMHQTSPDYLMTCNCQSRSCRKQIKGNDWYKVELQQKYAGYLPWYIEQKIKQLSLKP